MTKLAVLVVEDNPLAQKVLAAHLTGHNVEFAADLNTARQKLSDGNPDICFIDLKLGDKDDKCSGLKLIPLAQAKGSYCVVMSGHGSEPYVQKAYELGCHDFYAKGNEEVNVSKVLARFNQKRKKISEEFLFSQSFVTQDPQTRALIHEALNYAPSDLPILILGPSGTGKTKLASIIHDASVRRGEFVAINCSAYTQELLEAELFGYKRGAFTGANENRKGKLLMANEGTLFLDEIGSMSLEMQAKLLKAIEEKSFYPLGSERPETSNFRIISATLEDIQSLIKAGKLRFDFFQRIHGLTIELKPLAERKEDIFALVDFFTRQDKRLAFTEDAKEELLRHDWPGNIRELKKLVDLLVAGERGRVAAETVKKMLKTLRLQEGGVGFASEEQYRFAAREGLPQAIDRFIDAVVKRHLESNGGIKTKAVKDLRISTRLLYQSLERSGIPYTKRNVNHDQEHNTNGTTPIPAHS
ncbi:MAG: sigma-54-dependent Fis family transcriptional regulator [Elusimicrobia bacterium]|nr:sigma-54-dependent Fis family transcriptional regulator [Elusimicrobiota bacterium]